MDAQGLSRKPTRELLTTIVDYRKPFKDMVKAAIDRDDRLVQLLRECRDSMKTIRFDLLERINAEVGE
jgi:hypothetical protein